MSLNVKKSTYTIFHPIQKKTVSSFHVNVNKQYLKREYKIKYFGVVIDCHMYRTSPTEIPTEKIDFTQVDPVHEIDSAESSEDGKEDHDV